MNHQDNRAVLARLQIEAVLTHWELQVAAKGSRLNVPWQGFVTQIVVDPAAEGLRVGVRTAIGTALLADEARAALDEPLPLPENQTVVMDEDNELGLVWVRDYSGSIDPEQIGNAMLAQIEAARALAGRLGEECYLQKPQRAAGEPVGRGGQ